MNAKVECNTFVEERKGNSVKVPLMIYVLLVRAVNSPSLVTFNIKLPEVRNSFQYKKHYRDIKNIINVAKDKRTSVYFDRVTLQFIGLESAVIKQLKETYKGIDVDSELKKMSLWLTSSKGKKRKGNIGFILNWLNNASPSEAPTVSEQLDMLDQDTPLRPLLQEYLQDLWKDREHILEFNRIKRKS